MAKEWVCDTCLVTNEITDKICSCCGSVNDSTDVPDHHLTAKAQPVKEQKVTTYLDDQCRVRQKYTYSDLKHTSVFVVGSSEVDQLPTSCCDKSKKPGSSEFQSMYESSLPTPILTLPKMRVVSVACGALHTALLTSTGAVYTFGCNDMGALGRTSNSDSYFGALDSEPTLVELKFKVKKVTCGDNHTLFLSYNGTVHFTGSFKDSSGPIGLADYGSYESLRQLEYVTQPVKVPCEAEGAATVADICSGENHCVLLCQGGNSLYTFGSNEFYQLLIWDDEDIQNPTDGDVDLGVEASRKLLLTWPQHRRLVDVLSSSRGAAERPEDEDGAQGGRLRGNKRGRTNQDIINQIFTGNCTTFFQTKSLRLYGAGRNGQGEVGVGSDELIISKPRELALFRGVELSYLSGGQFFTMALVNNYVFLWGKASYLGIPPDYALSRPESVARPEEPGYAAPYEGEPDDPRLKKRRLDEAGRELDNLDLMEKLLAYDYGTKCRNALKAGKANSPILLQFKDPVKALFHGADSLFAITFEDDLYSWGSSQNFVLANGKDCFYQSLPERVPCEFFPTCKVLTGAGGSQHTVFLALKKRVPSALLY